MADAATTYIPLPQARPTAATSQMLAAVVNPRTLVPMRRMAPAPRNPMPATAPAAIREGSIRRDIEGSMDS